MTKLYIYISDPEGFLAGRLGWSMHISDACDLHEQDFSTGNYYLLSTVDVDINIESVRGQITDGMIRDLQKAKDKVMADAEMKVTEINSKIQSLLAIDHKGEQA